MNTRICTSTSNILYYCSVIELNTVICAVAAKAVVLHQSWDVALRLISVNAVILPWILKSYIKKEKTNLFFCKGKGPGPQSVSWSVEPTVQYMNNTLCSTVWKFLIFKCIYFQYHKQVDLWVHIFKLCADITEKSNSTESTGHFRRVKMLNYNPGPRPHKSNLTNHPIWNPATPYVPLFLWWFQPIPLSPMWLSSPLVSTLSSCKYAAGNSSNTALGEANRSSLNVQSYFQSTI